MDSAASSDKKAGAGKKVDADIEHIPESHRVISGSLEKYRKYFISTARENGLTIYSVGSGSATIEARCEIEGARIVCVDPDPSSYCGPDERVMIQPLYSSAKDAATDRPDTVGDCALMLIRASPDRASYDYNALETLRPKLVLSVYCVDGTDGSMNFHAMLHSAGIPSQFKWTPEGARKFAPKIRYNGTAAYYARETPPPRCFGGPAVALLWSDDFKITAKLPSGEQNPHPLTDRAIRELAIRSLNLTAERMQQNMKSDPLMMFMMMVMMMQDEE